MSRLEELYKVGLAELERRRKFKDRKRDREEYEDVRFLVNYKYSGMGYNSPEEMMESEPDYAEVLNGEVLGKRVYNRKDLDQENKIWNFCKSVVDLENDPNKTTFTEIKIKIDKRAVMHHIINKTSLTMTSMYNYNIPYKRQSPKKFADVVIRKTIIPTQNHPA